jgi:amphi-Trp domain-containing protein
MKHGKSSFRHESLQDRKSIRSILKALLDGIDKGKLKFSDADDEIVMQPQGLMNVRITASQEDNRNRVNLRITWQSEAVEDRRRKSLTVSTK